MKRRRRKSTARRKFRSRLLACIRRHNGNWVTIAKIACDFHPNHRDVRIAGTLKQLIAEGKVEEHARPRPLSVRYFRLEANAMISYANETRKIFLPSCMS